jgi:hypothetical protein
MLAGFMGWLKTTAISRLVAMPPLSGTTIDTVGLAAVETGGLATPPQLRKKKTTSGAVKTLKRWRIDIQFLPEYLVSAELLQVASHACQGTRSKREKKKSRLI